MPTKTSSINSVEELRTFAAIVERGSLVAASKLLGVTPNAVSRRLSLLEERLGRRLIDRTTRRLSVTDEGRRFHARVRRILDELDAAERELVGASEVAGTLRIGVHTDMIGPPLLAGLAEMLRASTRLYLQLHVAPRFIEPIAAGLDLAVHIGRPPSSSLVSVPIGSLVWGLAAAPSYVARRGVPTTPDELADHECLRMRRDREETHWELTRPEGEARAFPIGGRFETTDGRALVEALYAGIGIGIQLRSIVRDAVAAGALVEVLPGWRLACLPVFALLPPGRTKLPAVRAVLEALRSATRDLAEEPKR